MREEEAEPVLRAPEFEFWPRLGVKGPGSSEFVFLELQIPFGRWGRDLSLPGECGGWDAHHRTGCTAGLKYIPCTRDKRGPGRTVPSSGACQLGGQTGLQVNDLWLQGRCGRVRGPEG